MIFSFSGKTCFQLGALILVKETAFLRKIFIFDEENNMNFLPNSNMGESLEWKDDWIKVFTNSSSNLLIRLFQYTNCNTGNDGRSK